MSDGAFKDGTTSIHVYMSARRFIRSGRPVRSGRPRRIACSHGSRSGREMGGMDGCGTRGCRLGRRGIAGTSEFYSLCRSVSLSHSLAVSHSRSHANHILVTHASPLTRHWAARHRQLDATLTLLIEHLLDGRRRPYRILSGGRQPRSDAPWSTRAWRAALYSSSFTRLLLLL